jgi:hypothetical protein
MKENPPVIPTGVPNEFGEILVEWSGFDAVWATGFEISTTHDFLGANILPMSYDVLSNIIIQSGFWDNHVEDHNFLVSPDVYKLSDVDFQQLNDIGRYLPWVLKGIDRLVHETDPNHKINAIINRGIPRIYRRLQSEHLQVPEIIKVDLIKDTNGHFWIMELDCINKHGWGLTSLINRLRDVIAPRERTLPSVVEVLAHAILSSDYYREGRVTLIAASHEHFYLPEFRILSRALEDYGITLDILEEPVNAQDVASLSIDFPFLYRSPKAEIVELAEAYSNLEKAFLLPPKPFLGSKAIMALVSSCEEQNEVQDRLKDYVPEYHIDGLRTYIPPTFLVDKRKGESEPYWVEYARTNRCVLKACISNGAKQVYFPGDEYYWEQVYNACASNYTYVLQHEISSRLHKFRYFNCAKDIVTGEFYCRFTAYFSLNGLVDLRVVARPDKRVHGAPDAVQIGVVV